MLRYSGLLAARPSSQNAIGTAYFATDEGDVYLSAGGQWIIRPAQRIEDFVGFSSVADYASLPSAAGNIGWLFETTDDGKLFEAFPGAWYDASASVEGLGTTADQTNAEIRTAYETERTLMSQAEAEAGSATTVRLLNALRLKQAVDAGISALIDASPAALNTLNELAAALGDDENFAGTMTTALAAKVALTGDQTVAGVKTFSAITPFSLGNRTAIVALTYGASLTPDCAAGLSTEHHLDGGLRDRSPDKWSCLAWSSN